MLLGENYLKKMKFIAFITILICLLIVIPTSFAADNDTAIAITDVNQDSVLSSVQEEALSSNDDYYNVSVEDDAGDGTLEHPYKDLKNDSIKPNYIIHLADGEYHLYQSETTENLTIIGQNVDKTFITFNGIGFNVKNSLTLKNVTLVNLGIDDNSTAIINADNVIFKNSYSSSIISDLNTTKININNCTFANNAAQSGGAIFISQCFLQIKNSLFIGNKAEFFGGAINSLNSTLRISNVTFRDNKANFDGGSIYCLNGDISLVNSSFINNSAKNGGALHVDVSRSTYLDSNKFINNTASDYGGAICLFYNDNITLNDNNYYENNSAKEYPNEYISDFFQVFIGDGNYTMLVYNDTSIDVNLPSYYSLVDEGYVTPVKNQGSSGSCWSFATLAVLESCIKKATGLEFDLSENNMKNIITSYSYYGNNKIGPNSGGYASTGYNYLTSWLGPVYESSDPFVPTSITSSLLHSIFHIQNVLFLQRSDYTDNDEIKKAIMKYGGVFTQIHYSGNPKYQYYTGTEANHAVCIVGWNDDLEFDNAPGKGGWIIKNSHGTGRNINGYFYVSYYDKSCVPLNRVDVTYTIILNDTIKFDKNYQYDIPGRTDFFFNTSETVWYKNIFNSTDNEYLTAVSTHFEKNTDWELEIYVNNQFKHSQSGYSNPGYYTINLNNFIPLNKGDIFEVIFKITVDGDAGFPISEKISLNKLFYGPKLSYVSYDGENWTDLFNLTWSYNESKHYYDSQVACIKAFTILNPINTTINLTVENPYNSCLIKAAVLNQYGFPVLHGNVTFNIEGRNYVAEIENGVASLYHDFEKMGVNTIYASFEKVGFNSSSSQIDVKIYNEPLEISLNINVGMVDAEINITLSKQINHTVYIKLNDKIYDVNVTKGIGSLMLNNSDYGKNNVTVYIVSDYYYCENVTNSYNITHVTTYIYATDGEGYYQDYFDYYIRLHDKNDISISNKTVEIIVDGLSQEATTDDSGLACFSLKLSPGNYKINITCPEDDKYLKSEAYQYITIKSTIALPYDLTYTYNSNYITNFVDSIGSKLANNKVTLTVGNKDYNLTTDANGKLVYNLKLSPGSYKITVKNLATGEVKTQSIKVVKRITENKDLSMYYGVGKYYKVKVFDDNGKIAKGVKVTFTINNKKYTRTTDDNGYASFKINLKPKAYQIIVEYKGFRLSNNVVVKSTIITKDITVGKGKSVKFTAKLLDKNGKILKNKKVTFKFKGKTYKIKTNKKGKAILKIAKKYKKGKYTIKTSYGSLTIKNNIKIK